MVKIKRGRYRTAQFYVTKNDKTTVISHGWSNEWLEGDTIGTVCVHRFSI